MPDTPVRFSATLTAFGALPSASPPLARRAFVSSGPSEQVAVWIDLQHPTTIGPHRCDAVQVWLVLDEARGEVRTQIESRTEERRVIGPNCFCWIPPGTLVSAEWGSEAWLIILHLAPTWLESVTGSSRPFTSVVVESLHRFVLYDLLIGELIAAMKRETIRKKDQDPVQIVSLGVCLAARLLRAGAPSAPDVVPPSRILGEETVAKISRYVEKHLGEHLSPAALAKEARLSPGHFRRLFKETLRMTPEQYILKRRLQRAKDLIQSGKQTIAEIAQATGFSDHSHLTVQFKREFGVTPRSCFPSKRLR